MFANLFIYSKFSKASVQLISKVISRMALFKAELNENIYTSKYREMPNLRYEVQKERLERPFVSSMNNYPKKWNDIWWGPTIESDVYTTKILLWN